MLSYSAPKVVSRLLSVLVLSSSLLGLVGSAWPMVWAQEPEEGQIAYIGEDRNLWIMDADGTNKVQITAGIYVAALEWSPDGRRLAFSGWEDSLQNIYVINPDGTGLAQLGYDLPAAWSVPTLRLAWSPDGQWITSGPYSDGVYAFNAQSKTPIQLAADLGAEFYPKPTWSPDSRSLLFAAGGSIHIAHVDHPTSVRTIAVGEDPTWSPDGSKIAFMRFTRKEEWEGQVSFWTVNPDGGGLAQLSVLDSGWGADIGSYIAWSPRGDKVVLGPAGGAAAYIANSDGSDVSYICACSRALWSPSGDKIFFGWGQATLFDIETGELTNPFDSPPESPSKLSPITWSPDGNRIAFTTEDGILNILQTDTGARARVALGCTYELCGPISWSPDSSALAVGSWECDFSAGTCTESTYIVSYDGIVSHKVAAAWPAAWQPQARGPSIDDVGFRPNPNGYGFVNTQLERRREMFEQYFGAENVTGPNGEPCVEADLFFNDRYRWVAGRWSCLGFSLTSLLSYLDKPQPYSGLFAIRHFERLYEQPDSTQLTYSTRLTDSIAYYAGVQTGRQWEDRWWKWQRDVCSTNPGEMVESIRQGIRDRKLVVVVTLNTGLRDRDGNQIWHTVAPYRVEEVSPTEVDVYVYDSDARPPGEERTIRFRDSGDGWQWAYTFVGSLSAAGSRTGGCADMRTAPLEIALEQGKPPRDFHCRSSGSAVGMGSLPNADSPTDALAVVPARGDVLVQDALGQRIGWISGEFVSEIPGAYEIPQVAGDVILVHRALHLPAGEYTVKMSGSPNETFEMTLFGDGRVIKVSGQLRSPGSAVGLSVTPGLQQATLSGLDNLSSFVLSLDNELAAESRLVTIDSDSLSGSEDLKASFSGDTMAISRAGGNLEYNLVLENSYGQTFASERLPLEANETHALSPTNWTELESASVVWGIDDDSDGTIDETLVLEDQASVPMPTPTATVSPENDKGKGPCPGSLAMIGLVGLATLIGLTRQSPQSWRRR